MTPPGQVAAQPLSPEPGRAGQTDRPEPTPLALAGSLRSPLCVQEVEALMERLARKAGGEPAGEIAGEHLATGGKRLRARLALAALEALGKPREAGVGWAAACELLHNATLVHDDLQDGDRVRRGHPTVWARHGAAQAVNAGDLMLMLPFLALDHLDAPGGTRWTLARLLAGHAMELTLDPAGRVNWSTYRAVAEGKTGALFRLPVEGAAIVAGRAPEEARLLAAGFGAVGVLFQLQDDVLDLYGEKGRGAPGSDLREGKPSALVTEHLALHPGDAPWLREVLRAPRGATPGAEVERAIERFRTGGALERVLARIEAAEEEALRSPGLAREPSLRELAAELVQVALAPIEGVRRAAGSRVVEVRG